MRCCAPIAGSLTRTQVGSAASAAAGSLRASALVGERRQLTVMFCDLEGSTALSQRLDPEDLRDILRSYYDAVSRSVSALDGHVSQYLGDGALVFFGYPHAHEDDPQRAVWAGLALLAEVSVLNEDFARRYELCVSVHRHPHGSGRCW